MVGKEGTALILNSTTTSVDCDMTGLQTMSCNYCLQAEPTMGCGCSVWSLSAMPCPLRYEGRMLYWHATSNSAKGTDHMLQS